MENDCTVYNYLLTKVVRLVLLADYHYSYRSCRISELCSNECNSQTL